MRATLLVAVSFAGAALCAPAPAPGPGGGFGGPAMLLLNEGVLKELKITEEQRAKIKDLGAKIRDKYGDEFRKLLDPSEQDRREKGRKLTRSVTQEVHKALSDILSPDQLKRFNQIELQERGAEAFHSEKVQAALQLTGEQKDKLKIIADDLHKQLEATRHNVQGDREGARKKRDAVRKEMMEKAAGVLTDDQKKAWKELIGEPFEVKFDFRRPEGTKPKKEKKSN